MNLVSLYDPTDEQGNENQHNNEETVDANKLMAGIKEEGMHDDGTLAVVSVGGWKERVV